MRRYHLFFPLFLIVLLAGCNNKVQLGGKVTYSDDQPVESGFVVFTTSTFQSRGMIKPDGTYLMSTMGDADGIPPGDYAVYLGGTDKRVVEEMKDGSLKTTDIPQVDKKFTSPETSGLTFTVDGKTKRFDIQVERVKR